MMAIASCLTPEDHKDEETEKNCDDCWGCGVAHGSVTVFFGPD